jgi:hypothetical protein
VDSSAPPAKLVPTTSKYLGYASMDLATTGTSIATPVSVTTFTTAAAPIASPHGLEEDLLEPWWSSP